MLEQYRWQPQYHDTITPVFHLQREWHWQSHSLKPTSVTFRAFATVAASLGYMGQLYKVLHNFNGKKVL